MTVHPRKKRPRCQCPPGAIIKGEFKGKRFICAKCNAPVLPAKNKYNAKKVKTEDYTFDSGAEFKEFCSLQRSERAKEITGLAVHPKFDLYVNGILICTYRPDFGHRDKRTNKYVITEVKGCVTADFKIKWALLQALYPEFEYRLVKA